MGLKEAYQEKLEAQLKEWSAKFNELQAKAEIAKADAKIELQKHLQTLQAKQEAAQHEAAGTKGSRCRCLGESQAGFGKSHGRLEKRLGKR